METLFERAWDFKTPELLDLRVHFSSTLLDSRNIIGVIFLSSGLNEQRGNGLGVHGYQPAD